MRYLKVLFLIVSFTFFVNCSNSAKIVDVTKFGEFDTLKVRSAAIAHNTINEPNEKTIYVMLPPGYEKSEKKYPVIYYLHGQGSDSSELLAFEKALYAEMQNGSVKPFIVVSVNGNNSLGGSFYVNSARTGKWMDHIADELVTLIDRNYRTTASPRGRGLMGFSMGGFGVLNMGLTRSDRFGAVWALCPGIIVPQKGIIDALQSWEGDSVFLKCYGAAFSTEGRPPALDGTPEDNKIVKDWESGFGNWEERIKIYMEKKERLKEFRIVYGEIDGYKWIPEGSQYLADLFLRTGLPVSIQAYPFGHSISSEIVITDAMPFFARTLD
jgi:predicted esterase